MKTPVAYLAVAGTAIFWSALGAQLVTRVGVKSVLVDGMTALSAGLIYFTQLSPEGSYLGDLLPGLLLIAVGLGFSFVPISIAALAGVQPSEAGLASGLIKKSTPVSWRERNIRVTPPAHIVEGRLRKPLLYPLSYGARPAGYRPSASIHDRRPSLRLDLHLHRSFEGLRDRVVGPVLVAVAS
jgi:hypothetical protein